jgi:hypothetical protein
MKWKYFSREDRRSVEVLERKRQALLIQLHPDKVGSSEACEAMLTEYAQILQHLKGGSANAATAANAGSLFEQLPDLLRSVGVDPEQLKAAAVARAREAVGQVLEGTLTKLFKL